MLSISAISAILAFTASVNASAFPGRQLLPRHTDGNCEVEPAGFGPVTNNPDTAEAFLANPVYGQSANAATTPSGYSLVFQNLEDATATSGYLGFEYLTTYDPAYCASQCTNTWKGCDSFNIYFERDPTIDPGVNCPDPPSLTYIKCSYWSSCIDASSATNDGQYCQDFHLVVAGSNGYAAESACAAGTTTTTTTTAAPTTTTTTTAAPTTTTTTTTTTSAAAQCTGGSSVIGGRQCSISCNADRPGGDYSQQYTGSLAACESACAADANCLSAQYHEDNGYCYFKSSRNGLTTSNGVDTVDCDATPTTTTTTTTTKATTTVITTTTTTTVKPTTTTTTTTVPTTTTTKSSTTTTTTTTVPTTTTTKSSTTTTTTTTVPTTTTTKSSTTTTTTVPTTTTTTKSSTTTTTIVPTTTVKPTTTTTSCTTTTKPTTTTTSCTTTTKATTTSVPTPSLTSCPQPLGYICPGSGRTLYAICPDTDYQISSPQIYYSVADNKACAAQCDSISGCTKAVYNASTKTCYLKGSPSVQASNWHPNPGFTTLERVSDGSSTWGCKTQTYSVFQNGKSWNICPATGSSSSSGSSGNSWGSGWWPFN